VLRSNAYSASNELGYWAEFVTTEDLNLNMGQFYKIQMAYIDTVGDIGYYSTVGVIKATSAPELSIDNFLDQEINYLGRMEFVGKYWQNP
jgi:hypothetical protein